MANPSREDTLNLMCEHMRDVVAYCESAGVLIGGCGDCGSPWLTCQKCDQTTDSVDYAFTDKQEQSTKHTPEPGPTAEVHNGNLQIRIPTKEKL